MSELKPVQCGCGGNGVLNTGHQLTATGEYLANVKCDSCGIASKIYMSLEQSEAEEMAVEAWNLAMGRRTAKVDWINGEPYCPMCGDRLEWE